jgi:molybdopterin synthase catalytic subunit
LTARAGVHEKGTFSVSDLISNAKRSSDCEKMGAMTLFIGVARGETLEGEKVRKLKLEAYEEKADEVLDKICDDLSKKSGIVDVQIHHLLGEFDVGEEMVYVLVAGSHRTDVFPVLREAVRGTRVKLLCSRRSMLLTLKVRRVSIGFQRKRARILGTSFFVKCC